MKICFMMSLREITYFEVFDRVFCSDIGIDSQEQCGWKISLKRILKKKKSSLKSSEGNILKNQVAVATKQRRQHETKIQGISEFVSD